jgi:hypothetical protein
VYQPSEIPLRDRRAIGKPRVPGLQQPWNVLINTSYSGTNSPALSGYSAASVGDALPMATPLRMQSTSSWQRTLGSGVDPFNAFPIEMPFQSIPLLHYCKLPLSTINSILVLNHLLVFSAMQETRALVSDKRKKGLVLFRGTRVAPLTANSLSMLFGDAAALRIFLLLAAIHYAWNTKQITRFESTYYYHKVESIRMVNEKLQVCLSKQKSLVDCVRQIAAMALVEVEYNRPAGQSSVSSMC